MKSLNARLAWALAITLVVLAGAALYLASRTGTGPAPSVTRDALVGDLGRFLYASWQPDGTFALRHRCEGASCETVPANPDSYFGWSTIGLLDAAAMTGNASFKEAADIAIERVLRMCQVNAAACEQNFLALEKYYALTGDDAYLEAMMKVGGTILNITVGYQDPEHLATANSYKKLESLWRLSGDDRYKDAVTTAADAVLERWPADLKSDVLYQGNRYPVKYLMPHVVNGLFLPAYRLTNDLKYLQAAIDFYDNADISQNLGGFRWEGGLTALMHVVEGMLTVGRLEPSAEPLEEARLIMQQVVDGHMDSPERPILDGQGGLATGVYDQNEFLNVNYKNVLLNGWIAHVLTDDAFRDTTFTLNPVP